MMKILLQHGPRAGSRKGGPSRSKHGDAIISHSDTCVVTGLETQNISAPQMDQVVCLGGHGSCYGTPKSGLPPQDVDLFNKNTVSSVKTKGKQNDDSACQFQMTSMQLGQLGTGFAMSQEGQFAEWDLSHFSSGDVT